MRVSVVLHADDFGLNAAVNEGILRGFARGLLTSTALLANGPAAAEAIHAWKNLARERVLPSSAVRSELDDRGAPFDLGVHLNLTQGRPLTGQGYPAELLDDRGRFPGILRLFGRLQVGHRAFAARLRAELAAQITFLLDHGIRPTHLNGHQYVETIPQVAHLVPGLLEQFHIRVVRIAVEPGLLATTFMHQGRVPACLLALVKRHFARRFGDRLERSAVPHPQIYFGTAHAGRIDAELMRLYLRRPPRSGMIEVALHPATRDERAARCEPDGWQDPLASLRPRELELLESAELPTILKAGRFTLGRLSALNAA